MQTKGYATIMAVMARETWTDERLDDLKEEMNGRFDRIEGDIREIRSDIKEMQRIMIGGFVTLLIALIGTRAL